MRVDSNVVGFLRARIVTFASVQHLFTSSGRRKRAYTTRTFSQTLQFAAMSTATVYIEGTDAVFELNNGSNFVKLSQTKVMRGLNFIIDNKYAPTQYRKVKENRFFEMFYGVSDRAFRYEKPPGARIPGFIGPQTYEETQGTAYTEEQRGAACQDCGLFLPLRQLTIDHQSPQTGGEYKAVLKVFRACGWTVEGPKGAKGQQILNTIGAAGPMNRVYAHNARSTGHAGTSRTNRYTMNEFGAIVITLLSNVGVSPQNLIDACMHNVINLRPVCGPCNSSRGNGRAVTF